MSVSQFTPPVSTGISISLAAKKKAVAERMLEIDYFTGRKLEAIRKMRGLTQSELGTMIGVTFQTICKYEGGNIRINSSRLYLLAEALETPIWMFYDLGHQAELPAGANDSDTTNQNSLRA
ncbi:MAG: helix-turn-helix protein [Parcubacteria group bacterium]|nr:helix-turn-helix protein [Parcubacteria group bacterium]